MRRHSAHAALPRSRRHEDGMQHQVEAMDVVPERHHFRGVSRRDANDRAASGTTSDVSEHRLMKGIGLILHFPDETRKRLPCSLGEAVMQHAQYVPRAERMAKVVQMQLLVARDVTDRPHDVAWQPVARNGGDGGSQILFLQEEK